MKIKRLTVRESPPARMSTRGMAPLPSTWNPEQNSCRVIAATENPVPVWDWDRYEIVPEVLMMDGMEMPASGQVPLLDSHDRSSTCSIMGSARNFAPNGQQMEADIQFAGTPDAMMCAQKMREGHLTDLSVGYQPIDSVYVPEGETAMIGGREFTGPMKVTRKWALKELSLTPIGADPAAKARAASPEGNKPPQKKEAFRMNAKLKALLVSRGLAENSTDEEALAFLQRLSAADQEALRSEAGLSQRSEPLKPAGQTAPPVDVAGERSSATLAERERITTIREACSIAGMDDLCESYVSGGVSVEEARAGLFDAMKKRGNKPVGVRTEAGMDERDKFRAAAVDGIVMRSGIQIEKPADGAGEFRGRRLMRIAQECLERSGVHTRTMDDYDIAREAIQGRSGAMATSSSDFPNILANIVHRVLRRSYDTAPETWQVWTGRGGAVDFKNMSRLQLSEAPDLELITEGGEYREGSFSESAESYVVKKYGKIFSVTWEAIVNDDLSALTRIPMAFGAASARKIGDIVYGILTANANMSDSVALFYSTHNNLAAAGNVGAPSVTTLDYMRTCMRKQKGIASKQTLNVTPRYLLLPAALETSTDVVLRSPTYPGQTTGAAAGVTNPFQNSLIPVVDPRLDATSAKAWYGAADPAQFDTIEVSFLDGRDAPWIEEEQGFDVDGRRYKVRIVVGAKALDWRGLHKNPGE